MSLLSKCMCMTCTTLIFTVRKSATSCYHLWQNYRWCFLVYKIKGHLPPLRKGFLGKIAAYKVNKSFSGSEPSHTHTHSHAERAHCTKCCIHLCHWKLTAYYRGKKSLHVDFIFKAYKADESMKRKTGHVHSCLYSRLGMLQKPIMA